MGATRSHSLSATLAEELDRACDRFEAAWKAGAEPRIEDHLANFDILDRSALLRELIGVELDWRHKRGDSVSLSEYQARFPEDSRAVGSAFIAFTARRKDDSTPSSYATPRPPELGSGLLVGLLAVQNKLIESDTLVLAVRAWLADRSTPLDQVLANQGSLDPATRAILQALGDKLLDRNGGDYQKCLAALDPDPSTRRALTDLHDSEVDATLTHIPSDSSKTDERTEYAASTSVGARTSSGQRFRVLRPHARGGLGSVSVALDAELKREVALKQILGDHADNPSSRQRFLLEAEITGGLEHPGIVPVYGLGTDADDRPYYAMRFIRGNSLKDAIKGFHQDEALKQDPGARSLELRKLLRRFLDVCNAIEYAHRRGVLHRDLKPGNIMVGKYGETLVVDWGLAKLIRHGESSRDEDEPSLQPSVSSGGGETLPGSTVGTPAFMSPEQAAGALEQIGPASDVYSLGATLYAVLTGRPPLEGSNIERILRASRAGQIPSPRAVDPSIDPALEAICLKAMALEPKDRYASPRELAEDVERWTADEPVSAWREPLKVRARRWMKRHRPLVVGLSAASLVALVSLALATFLLARSETRERDARLLAQKQERRAIANADLAETERICADTNARLAREAVDKYFVKVSENRLLDEPGMKPLRSELLVIAREYYEGFVIQKKDDPELQMELGWSFFRLARVSYDLDTRSEAMDQMKQAIEIFSRLTDSDPDDEMPRIALLTSRDNLAAWDAQNGQSKRAEETFRDTLKQWEALSEKAPENLDRRNMVLKTVMSLANIHMLARKVNESLGEYTRSIEIGERLVADKPDDAGYRSALATSYSNRAVLELNIGQLDAADKDLAIARARFEALARDEPRVSNHRRMLAETLDHLGSLDISRNKAALAEKALNEAVAIYEGLSREHPDVRTFRHSEAVSLNKVGLLFLQTNQPAKAEPPFHKAEAILEELVKANPKVLDYQYEHAMTLNDTAGAFLMTNRLDEGEAFLKRALAIRQRLVDEHPDRLDYASVLGSTQVNLGFVGAQRKDKEAARDWYARGTSTLERVLKRAPRDAYAKQMLTIGRRGQVELLPEMNRHAEAVEAWNSLIALSSPRERPALRMSRAESMARAGEPAMAAEEATILTSDPAASGDLLFHASRVLAIASASARAASSETAERYASLACASLSRAVKAGVFRDKKKAALARTDPALAPLRARSDYPVYLLDLTLPDDPFQHP
jgi:serine/threonine-protein kinase